MFKKMIIGGMVVLVGATVYCNSASVQSKDEAVFASITEKYSTGEIAQQNSEEVVVITEDAVEEPKVEVKKYLHLDVDMSLRTHSYATAEDIDKMLEGTALHGLGKAFVEAEAKYNVNALYMVGLACVESGYGTSNFAVNRNNLYGWNAVDSDPNKATSFKSKEEATLFVASKLDQNYLNPKGVWHEGESARSIDVHYCTDKKHANKIVNVVNELLKKLN